MPRYDSPGADGDEYGGGTGGDSGDYSSSGDTGDGSGEFALDYDQVNMNLSPEDAAQVTAWAKDQAADWENKSDKDFDWKFTGNLIADLIYNGMAYVSHVYGLSPKDIQTLNAQLSDPESDLSGDYTSGGGADRDGTLNSDGTLNVGDDTADGTGDGDSQTSLQGLLRGGLDRLWGDITTESPYEKALSDMGITAAKTSTDIMSGNFELPPWMQQESDARFKTFTEATTRKGAGPGSTAYGQGSAAFNTSEGKLETNFGLGMLGMTGPLATGSFGMLNTNKNQEYSALFGGGTSLLSSNRQNTQWNKSQPSDPKDWETLLEIGADIYSTSSNYDWDWK